MNRWDCGHPGCGASAVGVGGAVGLRAIGWYFAPGPAIFCPRHRPDGIPCVTPSDADLSKPAGPCAECRGEVEAARHQAVIGVMGVPRLAAACVRCGGYLDLETAHACDIVRGAAVPCRLECNVAIAAALRGEYVAPARRAPPTTRGPRG